MSATLLATLSTPMSATMSTSMSATMHMQCMHISIFQNGVANDTKMGWQMIQIWGGKRYKRGVANYTKYGVAKSEFSAETQPI